MFDAPPYRTIKRLINFPSPWAWLWRQPWLAQVPVLDRYILQELLPPFLFGVGAFSSLGLSLGALFELVRRVLESGLPPAVAIQVFALRAPYWVGLAFPMATLLATLLTFNRLGSTSELTAFRACGISLYRWVTPALVLSCLVTGLTFLFNEAIVPTANYQANQVLERALSSDQPKTTQRNITYQEFDPENDRELLRQFYASRYEGGVLHGVTVLDFSEQGLQQILTANTALWDEARRTWIFSRGTIYLVSPDGGYRSILTFERQEIALPRAPLDLATQRRSPEEMTILEAQNYLSILRQSGDFEKIRKWQIRIQQKIAIPFICVVLGLVGAALGSLPQARPQNRGFGLSVLIIFFYYVLIFTCEAFSRAGVFSPFLGAWLPNFFGIGFGAYILRRAAARA